MMRKFIAQDAYVRVFTVAIAIMLLVPLVCVGKFAVGV